MTGALFVKSNVNLRVGEGVTLLGSQDDADYPSIWTRVAGVEMKWPAALINVNDQRNVRLSGGGTIDGRGEKWWQRYWDLRRDYEPKGLRWAVNYRAGRCFTRADSACSGWACPVRCARAIRDYPRVLANRDPRRPRPTNRASSL